MKATRLYTGSDGESHFEDFDIPLKDAGDIGHLSQLFKASGVIFRETIPEYNYTWHNAPRRQFIIMMDGEVDIEIGDGTIRRFGIGDILLAEDIAGHGHISRAVNNRARKSIFIALE